MFVDLAKIYIKAGDGGAGAVNFHREKYVAAGGPDGGDGGKGGDIVFQVDDNLNTLIDFRYKRKFVAPNGEKGGAKKCSGRGGEDVIIRVPRGTLIRDAASGRLIYDMSSDEPYISARGGKGGWGNSHFATPTRQCPRFAKSGIPGEEKELQLELKLLADVGLLGYPNVGKSTLLSVVSAANPKIANYHFTTLIPNLGVVRIAEGQSFVMADIPGLIEGASEGVGLGHEFLRHVERCRLLIHIIDVSGSEARDPVSDFETLNNELASYSAELAKRPQIVAANKTDLASREQIDKFKEYITSKGYDFYEISAATTAGVNKLMFDTYNKLKTLPPVLVYEPEPEPMPEIPDDVHEITITESDGVYIVEGKWLLKVMGSVNFDDYESLQYFQRVLRNSGVFDKLEQTGIHEGDTVSIYDVEFDYVP
jgi:GTP-binding protein